MVRFLGRLAAGEASYIEELERVLSDRAFCRKARIEAVRALATLEERAALIVPSLMNCLETKLDPFQMALHEALRAFGPKASWALPVLDALFPRSFLFVDSIHYQFVICEIVRTRAAIMGGESSADG